MMAIRRFRFALLVFSILVAEYSLAPEAAAHRPLIEQVAPDEDGDGPLQAASGGSSSSLPGERASKTHLEPGTAVVCEGPGFKLDFTAIILLLSKTFGLIL